MTEFSCCCECHAETAQCLEKIEVRSYHPTHILLYYVVYVPLPVRLMNFREDFVSVDY